MVGSNFIEANSTKPKGENGVVRYVMESWPIGRSGQEHNEIQGKQFIQDAVNAHINRSRHEQQLSNNWWMELVSNDSIVGMIDC